MGNKLGRRRQLVEDKYTRPQGLLYQHKYLDHKKLRKLILDSKLAPCYHGRDDTAASDDLEECPICFLCYPSLNRSRCCIKGICTECFLQMKTPKSTRPTQCPFCKTSNYAVEYRGVKTMEEKVMEQIEEQRVIEANIRMRQQERKDEEEKMQKREDINSLSRITRSGKIEYSSIAEPMEVDEIVSNLQSSAMEHPSTALSIRRPRRSRQNRYPIRPLQSRQNREEFGLNLEDIVINLEDIMVLQAIWLSIQEEGRHNYEDAPFGQHVSSEDRSISSAAMAPRPPPAETASSSSSPYGGLAFAISALGEHRQVGGTTVAWQ